MGDGPVAVNVLTGFLGAGKTTLLNRLLRDPALRHTGVIINEFGDVSIDHLLVESSDEEIVQLSDGCVCCTVRGELIDTIADLLDRAQTGRIARLERIVIETTGLADPIPVLKSLLSHPVLVHELRLDGVLTVVDAVHGEATLDRHAEAVRQVGVADRIVISKTDLVDEGTVASLRARLSALNPGAGQISSDEALTSLLSAGLWKPDERSADVRRWLGEADEHAHHAHDHGEHCHDHDHGHGHDHSHGHSAGHAHHGPHDHSVTTLSLTHPVPVSWPTIEMFLDLLRSTHGERLLRMKGVIAVSEDIERPLVVHGVQGLLHPPVWLPAWPAGMSGTRLVIIGQDLDADHVRRLFAGFMGAVAPDTPDRAALTDNPLAINGFR